MSPFRTASLLAVAVLTMGSALPLSAQQTGAAAAQNAAPAVAEKLKQPGLPNFGRVNQRLYRGGQPESEGYDALRKLEVGIVVNFNTSDEDIREERAEVESRGMRYVSIPWSARSLPRREQVAESFRLLRENPEAVIFVHCRRGADRTGVMLATYRMALEGWTPEQALTEMERFKFHGFWYRHLKRYVRQFPALLESDPGLSP
ncbi:MAG: fused DSP-PTPase phosphatase/NAD kinase-like protein [bacterium]